MHFRQPRAPAGSWHDVDNDSILEGSSDDGDSTKAITRAVEQDDNSILETRSDREDDGSVLRDYSDIDDDCPQMSMAEQEDNHNDDDDDDEKRLRLLLDRHEATQGEETGVLRDSTTDSLVKGLSGTYKAKRCVN